VTRVRGIVVYPSQGCGVITTLLWNLRYNIWAAKNTSEGAMRRAMLIAVLSSNFVMAGPASAWDTLTGNMLFDNCKDWPRGGTGDAMSVFADGTCVGYIWGVASALSGSSFCIPTEVQPNQLTDVVKGWLDGYPEVRHHTASSLVAAALKEKFPCN
jgi:hypothetical protein